MMLPIILPHPVRLALLEMIRPLAKECVPPSRLNVAALLPSPTTNAEPFATAVPLVLRTPPLKTIRPAELVKSRLSVVMVPPLRVRLPLGTLTSPAPLLFVAVITPPVIMTSPVDSDRLPTRSSDERLKFPPDIAKLPLTVFVGLAATKRREACTPPAEIVI